MLRIDVITIFTRRFAGWLSQSLVGAEPQVQPGRARARRAAAAAATPTAKNAKQNAHAMV